MTIVTRKGGKRLLVVLLMAGLFIALVGGSWLGVNDWGVTAFVLTYRLSPRYDNEARTRDGERALRLVRAHRPGVRDHRPPRQ